MQLNVTLEHRDAKDYVSAPYNLDQPPRYFVLGGLIFQEPPVSISRNGDPTGNEKLHSV